MAKKKAKSTALIPVGGIGGGKISVLYRRMQIAVAQCHSIDDCRGIAKQADAIAAYFTQIEDHESVRKFIQVKLRAWRRIGEILTGAGVNREDCVAQVGPLEGQLNTAEYIRRIRAAFKGQRAIEDLKDSAFRQALRIAELPPEYFEENVTKHHSIDALVGAFARVQRQQEDEEYEEWLKTPEGRQAEEAARREAEERRREAARWELERQAAEKLKLAQEQEDAAEIAALKEAQDEALDEVGITLDRRDRKQMKQIVFLIKREVYETLRQAAFDERVTMQAILRAGLLMWLIAHDYSVALLDLEVGATSKHPQGRKRDAQDQQDVR